MGSRGLVGCPLDQKVWKEKEKEPAESISQQVFIERLSCTSIPESPVQAQCGQRWARRH